MSIECGRPFRDVIDKYVCPEVASKDGNPEDMLTTLFQQCVPHARKIFDGQNAPMKLFHVNDYVVEKTFVYGIMSLSKWLGEEWFSWGVYYWPQAPPAYISCSDPDLMLVPEPVPTMEELFG